VQKSQNLKNHHVGISASN